jgi:hypothetical protein
MLLMDNIEGLNFIGNDQLSGLINSHQLLKKLGSYLLGPIL